MSDTAAARRIYSEEIGNREKISSARLLRALSAVPRERFLGKGPWRVRSNTGRKYKSTESADPIHLYQDVLVAIDEAQKLDTGLPSLWLHLFDILKIKKKERVAQIGCGLGYFSAILSEVVGVEGTVFAIDCDKKLVQRARSNLKEYSNVEVVHGDGCCNVGGQADVIIVHAGFTHPHPLWIKSLRPAGRLLVPLTKPSRQGTVVKITRLGDQYLAEAIKRLEIFPCRGRGNTALDERLTDWWETASALAPLRFRNIDRGLPSNIVPRPRKMRKK
jgi:protein-L-isoaspartate(D-aspartate) O-methyltransferase